MIDFLCIGAQKAGTTWLNANLKKHPQIWTPPFVKEIHYFDVVHLGYDPAQRLKKIHNRCETLKNKKPELSAYFEKVCDPDFAFTDAWYQHIFSIAPEGVKKGESTPLYSALDEKGVRHVKRLMPEVKIIYLVRDPFDRAKSSLGMQLGKRNGRDKESMVNIVKDPLFEKRGSYSKNVTQWDHSFPPEQILYVPFGRIKSDPEGVMREVEAHLGLPAFDGYPKLTHMVNAAKKKSIEIDEEVLGMLRERTVGEYAFLKKRFGEQFFNLIK